jgi:hypothetical protein
VRPRSSHHRTVLEPNFAGCADRSPRRLVVLLVRLEGDDSSKCCSKAAEAVVAVSMV